MAKNSTLTDHEYIQINQAIFSLRNVYESGLRKEKGDAKNELSIAELGVLMVLGQADKITSRTLSVMMDLTPGTISQYVNRLRKRGLIDQLRDENDRRIWWLTLTKEGHDVYRSSYRGAVQYTRDMISMLDAREQRLLHDLLVKTSHGNGYEWQ